MQRPAKKISPRAPKFTRKDPLVRKRQLIEAAIACLAEGGMSGFTVARICKKAGISRGLISHHFKGKDELLVQAYETMTAHLDAASTSRPADAEKAPTQALLEIIEANFSGASFDKTEMKAWLALWGETSGNPRLLAVHRRRYASYHRRLKTLITAIAQERGRQVDAGKLATMLIALIDGLWLEWCLDATRVTRKAAKAACTALLEPHLGPIGKDGSP